METWWSLRWQKLDIGEVRTQRSAMRRHRPRHSLSSQERRQTHARRIEETRRVNEAASLLMKRMPNKDVCAALRAKLVKPRDTISRGEVEACASDHDFVALMEDRMARYNDYRKVMNAEKRKRRERRR